MPLKCYDYKQTKPSGTWSPQWDVVVPMLYKG